MDPRGCSVLFSFAFLSPFQEQWWNDITYLSYSLKIPCLHACCATKAEAPRSLGERCLPLARAFVGPRAKWHCLKHSARVQAHGGCAPADVSPTKPVPPCRKPHGRFPSFASQGIIWCYWWGVGVRKDCSRSPISFMVWALQQTGGSKLWSKLWQHGWRHHHCPFSILCVRMLALGCFFFSPPLKWWWSYLRLLTWIFRWC